MKAMIEAMSAQDIGIAIEAEDYLLSLEQLDIATYHTLHAGVYTRTIHLAAGCTISGALIRVDTTLIVTGHMRILIGSDIQDYDGVSLITASKNRKQVMTAVGTASITMVFASNASTVQEAEDEFTVESDKLMSRQDGMVNILNGEMI